MLKFIIGEKSQYKQGRWSKQGVSYYIRRWVLPGSRLILSEGLEYAKKVRQAGVFSAWPFRPKPAAPI